MTRVGNITTVLEDINSQLKWVRNQELEPQLETNTSAIDLLLDGAPYLIGMKERSEDAIQGIPQWVSNHQGDDATKVCTLLNAVCRGATLIALFSEVSYPTTQATPPCSDSWVSKSSQFQ
jgi:hypothetical protein